MSVGNSWSYWQNGHGREHTKSFDGYSGVLAAVQQGWGLTPVESLQHLTDSAERNCNRTNMAETNMSQDPTTNYISSVPQWGSGCADDERFIRRSEEELRKEPDGRMLFVWHVIGRLLYEVKCQYCPKGRELWLRIIEGDDDDLWLWADGDEKWLTKQAILHWMKPDSNDWVSAQSALRRRVAQQRYPSGTGRNEKVRNATIKQRIYAILWLIASSKGVAELFASHGRTPPTFRIPEIASILSRIIYNHWDVFPSQTDDWESALTRSKEDGCKCSPADCRGIREWFDMVVWLGDIPPVLEVGDKPCVRCRSLLKSRYEDIAAKCTVTSHVSLLDAFCNYRSCETEVAFLPHLSPTAKLQANRTLEPLMKKHGYDVRYSPPVNRYSECLRPWVAKLQCISNPSYQDGLPTAGLPDNIFDGVNDPWVVLGIIMSASYDPSSDSGTDLHDEDWHRYFSTGLRSSLQCFDMPVLPRLSSMGFMLCHTLDQDGLEERSFSRVFRAMDASEWVKSDQDGRQLRLATAVIVAVTTFLRSKRDVDLYSCRRCQVVCMEFFDSRPSAVGCEVANSGDHDNALEGSLSSPSDALLCSLLTHSMQRQHLYSLGLGTPNCVQRSDSGNRPCLGESTLRRHLSGRSISSSSMRSKSDKVEEIKDKLLGMLRELNLPYERLPWYTLEKDLKKHGCALVNWPAGVLRKRGNRGIHDLSAVEVNSLYEAIACPDESRRLRICRCPSTLTVAPVRPVDHTSAAASGSKRPMGPEEADFPGHPSKKIRFRDMTIKVSQQHSSEPRADGMVGS